MEFVCLEHMDKKKEEVYSPCRGKCNICKQKKVHGFSNPDHISNPFGYLYLIPKICFKCALDKGKCMWC
jgi:hypothetical protein